MTSKDRVQMSAVPSEIAPLGLPGVQLLTPAGALARLVARPDRAGSARGRRFDAICEKCPGHSCHPPPSRVQEAELLLDVLVVGLAVFGHTCTPFELLMFQAQVCVRISALKLPHLRRNSQDW